MGLPMITDLQAFGVYTAGMLVCAFLIGMLFPNFEYSKHGWAIIYAAFWPMVLLLAIGIFPFWLVYKLGQRFARSQA